MKLNKKQTKALDYLEDSETTELLYGGAAGGGKSVLGCYWQLKRRLKFPGTRGLIGRASLKTLKETTLQTFFEVCKMQGLVAERDYRFNQQSNIIYYPNGSQTLLKDLYQYPSDPNFDELGSLEITDAFADECNQMVEKAWNVVKSRIRYKLDDFGLIPKILGTCNPAKNYVYTKFYKPFKEGTLDRERKFVQALVSDNPDISKFYKENLLSLDKASKERLLFGNWEYDDDPSALMSYDSITDLFTNEHVEQGEKVITADIARFGSDKTVIMVWSGLRVEKIVTVAKGSVTDTADRIKDLQAAYKISRSRILVDEDGVGGGVKDILQCVGFVNNSSPLVLKYDEKENFANLKSQCYFRLSEMVNKNEIYIKCSDTEVRQAIIEELEQVKQKDMDKDGKKAVIPKETVKELLGRSPDYSDTLMMRQYFELKPKRKVLVA